MSRILQEKTTKIAEFVSDLVESKDYVGIAVLAFSGLIATVLLLTPFSSHLQMLLLKRGDLTVSFPVFAATQAIPCPFSFRNEVFVSDQPIESRNLENKQLVHVDEFLGLPVVARQDCIGRMMLQHYPGAIFNHPPIRAKIFESGNLEYFGYTRTSYFSSSSESYVHLSIVPDSPEYPNGGNSRWFVSRGRKK